MTSNGEDNKLARIRTTLNEKKQQAILIALLMFSTCVIVLYKGVILLFTVVPDSWLSMCAPTWIPISDDASAMTDEDSDGDIALSRSDELAVSTCDMRSRLQSITQEYTPELPSVLIQYALIVDSRVSLTKNADEYSSIRLVNRVTNKLRILAWLRGFICLDDVNNLVHSEHIAEFPQLYNASNMYLVIVYTLSSGVNKEQIINLETSIDVLNRSEVLFNTLSW